jgi:hypothetical protein
MISNLGKVEIVYTISEFAGVFASPMNKFIGEPPDGGVSAM